MPKKKTPEKTMAQDAATTMRMMIARLQEDARGKQPRYTYPVQPPRLAPGVLPSGMAMDAAPVYSGGSELWGYLNVNFPGGGFPGYPYLAGLATRAEYRAFASAMSTELTREWLQIVSTSEDEDKAERIAALEDLFRELKVRSVIQRAAEQDVLFGRGQIFLDIENAPRKQPLVLSPHNIALGSFKRIAAVEAQWTSPSAYNAIDPVAPDFFRPSMWFMLGDEIHASRLLTIITRPVPDLLKAAFNFGGMSLSQLAEPYVDNWLRTRQSVADLVNNFSILTLKTNMEQALSGGDAGGLFTRVQLFTETRSNKGLMLLNNESEDLQQQAVPLGGLHELQSQALEHLCTASRIPAMVLTGISPTGLNASSEGELRAWDNWISAQQEAYWREPLETILKVAELSLFGEIDDKIEIKFNPLYQQTPKEIAEINQIKSTMDTAYLGAGVLDAEEVRKRLAHDEDSGYQGLDVDMIPVAPENDAEIQPQPSNPDGFGQAQDIEFREEDHPRDQSGKFGSGNGSQQKSVKLTANEKSAISSYSGDDFLRINKELRSGISNDPQVARLDSAITKGRIAPHTVLYRGMSKDAARNLFPGGKIDKGMIVSDPAFVSTSTDKGIAGMVGLGGVVLKIDVPSGGTGLSMQGLTRNQQESEVLLPRNAQMRVEGVTPGKQPGEPVIVRVTYQSPDSAEDRSVSAAQHRAMEAAAHGHSTLGIPKSVGEEFVAKDELAQDDKWITVHPNGPDAKGQPALIGEGGEVKAGMGGKFNGQKLDAIPRTFKNEKWEAEHPAPKPAMTKPVRPEFMGKGYWNGKFYQNGSTIYVGERQVKLNAAKKKELADWESAQKEYNAYVDKLPRNYLNVPFEQKDEAKKHGARWDADKKKWYFPGEGMPAELQKYTASKAPTATGTAKLKTALSGSTIQNRPPKKSISEMTGQEYKEYLKKLRQRRDIYNNVANEGGEGYNPWDDAIRNAEKERSTAYSAHSKEEKKRYALIQSLEEEAAQRNAREAQRLKDKFEKEGLMGMDTAAIIEDDYDDPLHGCNDPRNYE